jgi:hypothetical protein
MGSSIFNFSNSLHARQYIIVPIIPIMTEAHGLTLLQQPVMDTRPTISALHIYCTGYLLVGSDFDTKRGRIKTRATQDDAEDNIVFMTMTEGSCSVCLLLLIPSVGLIL